MRRLALVLTGAVLVTFMAVACTETPADPLQATDAAAAMFNFGNGPERPGNSPVRRWEELFTDGDTLFDEKSGYWVYLGSEAVCGFNDDQVSTAQTIRSPSVESWEERLILRLEAGELVALIATEEDCNAVVAYGTVHFTKTDNDFRAWASDHNRHNAFGFNMNGRLTGVDGPNMNIHVLYRCVWEGFDADPAKCVEKLTIR